MDKYEKVYTKLNLPTIALQLAQGLLLLPQHPVEIPFADYGFPPALIPLWSTGSPSYRGFWFHWFVNRSMTIVEVDVEAGYQAYELARNVNQLTRIVLLRSLAADSSIEFGPLPQEIGIEAAELATLRAVASVSGDDMEAFTHSSYAQSSPIWHDLPLDCFPDGVDYTGDFPHDGMELTPEAVRRICTLEVSEALKERIAALPWAPPWFTTTDQAAVFEERLQHQDYAGAWMSVNSTGWHFAEAKNAMFRLAAQVNNTQFSLLTDAWTSQPHEIAGTY